MTLSPVRRERQPWAISSKLVTRKSRRFPTVYVAPNLFVSIASLQAVASRPRDGDDGVLRLVKALARLHVSHGRPMNGAEPDKARQSDRSHFSWNHYS